MSKKDLFAARYTPRDRKADNDAVAEFLQKGGKVQKLVDSKEAKVIIARRARRQKAADKRAVQDNPQGVIGGIPLFSNLDVMTVKDEE